MSLFLKIFLWFWLAMALIVGAITFVNWSLSSEPLTRQWEVFIGESINEDSQTAIQIYENEGAVGLQEYLERRLTRRRVTTVGVFDEKRNLIAGNLTVAEISDLFDKAAQNEEPQFKQFPDKRYGAQKVFDKNGVAYFYVIELRRYKPPGFFTQKLILQILAVVLVGGLLCYLLARYLTSPITKLRDAAQQIARGDLSTRVVERVGKRRDELSDLAKDFDEMAQKIENLITSEKRLTQDISHELRSPLARMNVALELARAKSTPETNNLIERLEKESDRLNELIGQLLTLSKLETGSQSFEKADVNLTKLLEKVVSDAEFEANANDRSVAILKKEETKVFGNEGLLISAIENVLRNAVKYTKEGTSVEISLEKLNGNAMINIRDHGGGVPQEDLDKLFKPFYRVEEARDRKSGGTGLGLAIAERAIAAHNGKILAKNSENGLIVEINLPLNFI